MTIPPQPEANLPSSIGPFRVLRLLGSGGMGRVYLASTRAGRPVAVKVVRESYAQDPRFRERFRVETEAALKVSGAFTAPVVAADPDAVQPWMATAYLPAPSLSEAVSTHGPMPEATVRTLGAGLAEALTAIHAAGLVHRDLKPSNILLTEDGPRVIDFGIARAVDGEKLTGAGQVLGTAGYLAPEQIAGRTATAAGDVFSLGATLVFAATGRGAFGESGLHILLYRTAYEEPDLTATPESLRPAVASCLAKEPWKRPHVPDLAGLFGAPRLPGTGWLPHAVEQEVRRREDDAREKLARHGLTGRWGRRRVLAAAGGTLAAAALTGGWLLVRGNSPDTPPPPKLLWRAPLPEGFTHLRRAARGQLLVTAKEGGGAAVLDPETGKARWRRQPYGNAATAAAGTTVYVIEIDGGLHARSLLTGKEHWRFAPPGNPQPAATDLAAHPGDEGWVYVTSQQTGELYALDSTGRSRWHHEAPRAKVHPLGDVVLCVTREAGGADNRRTVFALDARTGGQLWKYSPAVFGLGPNPNVRLALTMRHDTAELIALRVSDGRTAWTAATGLNPGEGIQNVSLATTAQLSPDGRIALFQRSLASGSFAALNTTNGKTQWRDNPKARQQLIPLGKTLFTVPEPPPGTNITAAQGSLTAYDLTTGARHWQTPDLGKGLHAVLRTFAGLVLLGINGGASPGLYGYALRNGHRAWEMAYTVDTLSQPWSTVSSGDRLWVANESEVMGFGAGSE
ncbi:serine/threonine-protein kinase [Streptomyces apocyni]|uniref:serine/threonine-protein kinase n=1 Tax=Streptomyces apocyni TaxID=2654677 RepID=UPI0018D121CD|nr:PQQ-binding-like beta-propeller repeat protein [Streptomyces apocyni]